MNGELVSVPRTAGDPVAPGAAAIHRGHERASFDRNPESFRFERVTRDPANVMSVRRERQVDGFGKCEGAGRRRLGWLGKCCTAYCRKGAARMSKREGS
jgi:hypothetical protein